MDYNGEAKITKGVYVGAGSSGMFQTFSEDSNQNFINVYYDSTQAAGTTITLSDESQTKLIEFVAEKEFATVIISLPNLETGKTYTLKTGDTEQTVTINSVSSSLGTSSGGFGDPGGHGGFGEPQGGGGDQGSSRGGGFGEPQGGGQGRSQDSGQGRPGRRQGGGFGEPNGQQPPDRRGNSEGRQGSSSNNQDIRGGRGRNFDNREQYGWENNSWDNGAWEGGQYPQDNQDRGSYDSQGYY